MSKKYNISKKSDMNRFMKDLENQVQNVATQSLYERTYEIDCPHCKRQISAEPGNNICPFCGNTVNLDLNIRF